MAEPPAAPPPLPLNPLVSAQMSRMPRRDSKPEMELRRALHQRGMRFRTHVDLPGRPDVAFTRAKIAVFLDGCFWHACPDHGVLPKNNCDWWRAKLEANVARDRRKDEALAELGWAVIHVWEHESASSAADLIERVWSTRRHLPRAAGPTVLPL